MQSSFFIVLKKVFFIKISFQVLEKYVFLLLSKISLKYNLLMQIDDNGKNREGVEDDIIEGYFEGEF